MCRVISVSSLDSVARNFVDTFGGYGIVIDEDVIAARHSAEEEAIEQVVEPLIRVNPRPVRAKGMW